MPTWSAWNGTAKEDRARWIEKMYYLGNNLHSDPLIFQAGVCFVAFYSSSENSTVYHRFTHEKILRFLKLRNRHLWTHELFTFLMFIYFFLFCFFFYPWNFVLLLAITQGSYIKHYTAAWYDTAALREHRTRSRRDTSTSGHPGDATLNLRLHALDRFVKPRILAKNTIGSRK